MSTPILNIYSNVNIFGDPQVTSNPSQKFVDWVVKHPLISVSNPKSERFSITPGSSLQVFSGIRATTLGSNSAFTSTLNSVIPGTYRFSFVTGTNPTLRTSRSLDLSTIAVTITVNNNTTATFTIPSGGNTFSGSVVGDNLWIPGPTTGDATTPFNVLNQGLWAIISVASNNLSITCIRTPGASFSATAETQTVASAGQLVVFSSAGVQIGDKAEISAGFSSVDFGTYSITNVTNTFFEIVPGVTLPLETSITPTATGLVFYSVAKRFVRIEADQEAAVQFNADASQNVRISPFVPADPNNAGYLEKWGTAYQLTVINRSPVNTLNIYVISAE